ncbi:MAG TPA: hypothetical protein DCO79_07880 [Spirochaeta sp.]|nr:hypothetical protein [Spirochaeta sp.]
MNLYQDAGELMLGSRLKRTGERFLTEIARVYRSLEIDFDPAWFPVFFLLDKYPSMTISGFTRQLQISQSGTTQLISGLEKKGLLEEFHEAGRDKRTKSVCLTKRGTELLQEVKPVWAALDYSLNSLLEETPGHNRLLSALSELEYGFEVKSLGDRVLEKIEKQNRIKTFRLEKWSSDADKKYREILLQQLADGCQFQPAIAGVLKAPDEENSISLMLLKSADDVIGFAVLNCEPDAATSALSLHSSWKYSNAETALIKLIEKKAEAAIDIVLHTGNTSFIAAAKKAGYAYRDWNEDFITLRRRK